MPTRALPDIALRAMSMFDPSVRAVTPMLGRQAGTTVVDCAESLIARNAVSPRKS
ncbi:MAG TPA: hypothetical protein VFX16_15315 [Pseudonocardiaceae bacterium]|nr:hypothetical protein [Pseudonocardiaceae bacterium]